MNDICKQRISERLMEAQEKEGLRTSDVAGLLGVTSNVVWCAKNTKYWRNFSEARWDLLQKWCNSGLSLRAYGKNGGHVPPTENVASEEITKLGQEIPDFATEYKDDYGGKPIIDHYSQNISPETRTAKEPVVNKKINNSELILKLQEKREEFKSKADRYYTLVKSFDNVIDVLQREKL